MDYGILGPTRVERDGVDLALGGTRRRALVALLAIHANRPVPADQVVEDLWEAHPPPGASATLRSHVASLRKVLGADRLVTRAGGYQLVVHDGELDCVAFEADVATAQAALDGGDATGAIHRLERGLKRWRGPALADAAGAPWAFGEKARLTDLRLVAQELRLEAHIEHGAQSPSVVGEAEAAVAEAPLRERRWALLMIALYRGGRQSDALRAYQRLRTLLGEELGIEPSHELMALERAILLHDPTLAASTSQAGVDVGRAEVVIPLPSRLAAAPDMGFFGRQLESAALADTLKEVHGDGRRRVMLVGGEPGIGKTMLAAEFARTAHTNGAIVVYGRCDEDLGIPYQPWIEMLDHVVSHASDELLAAHGASHGGGLGRLVPALSRRLALPEDSRTADPDAERYVLFAAVAGLLRAAAQVAPIVAVIDDLHWADKATLLLLRHLVSIVDLPWFLVGTYRDSELSTARPLADTLAALRRESGVERLRLAGLDDHDLLALLQAAAGRGVDDTQIELAHALYEETDGNPFFVREILRHLLETGRLQPAQDGGWTAGPELNLAVLPDSVREVVGRRVARLGGRARRILATAAVIGRDFDLDLLGAVTEAGYEELLDVVEAACAASVLGEAVEPPGRFTFAHALIQHTLSEDLGAARRSYIHARIAEALEELCGPDPGPRVGEIARHWLAATRPVDTAKAVESAQRAGDWALAGMAPDEAASWYDTALQLLGPSADPGRRCELQIGLGTAQLRSGNPAYRSTLLEAAHLAQLGADPQRLVRAALANNRGFVSVVGQVDTARVSVLEAALAAEGPDDSPARARLLATLAAELTYGGDADGRVELARESQRVARRLGDPKVLLDTLNLSNLATQIPAQLDERLELSALAVELAKGFDDPSARFWAASFRATSCAEAGDMGGVRHAVGQMTSIADALGQPVLRWRTTVWRCTLTCLTGGTESAEQLANEALEIGAVAGEPDVWAFFGANIAMIRTMQGRLVEIAALLGDAVRDNPGLPAYRAIHALALVEAGEQPRAAEMVADTCFADIAMDPLWTICMASWADVVARLGDRAAAGALAELLVPCHAHVPFPTCAAQASMAHCLAILAAAGQRFADAEHYFGEALAIHEGLESPYLVAVTKIAWAEMLTINTGRARAEASRERAHHLLVEAMEAIHQQGYAMLERRAGFAFTALDAPAG